MTRFFILALRARREETAGVPLPQSSPVGPGHWPQHPDLAGIPGPKRFALHTVKRASLCAELREFSAREKTPSTCVPPGFRWEKNCRPPASFAIPTYLIAFADPDKRVCLDYTPCRGLRG